MEEDLEACKKRVRGKIYRIYITNLLDRRVKRIDRILYIVSSIYCGSIVSSPLSLLIFEIRRYLLRLSR